MNSRKIIPHLAGIIHVGCLGCHERTGQVDSLRSDAAVDYLCFMPDLSVAQVGICEVASCRRADLYDICRDCQHCYETSGAGIINDNEEVPCIIPVRFLLTIVLT